MDQKVNKRKTQNTEASHYFHLISSYLPSGWELEPALYFHFWTILEQLCMIHTVAKHREKYLNLNI